MSQYLPGSVIYAEFGFYNHFGIISGWNIFGQLLVISNSKKVGKVIEEPLSDFSEGKKVHFLGHLKNVSPMETVSRARSKLGEKYSLLSNNCEHFISWVYKSEPTSPQLKVAIVLTVFGILGCLAFKKN